MFSPGNWKHFSSGWNLGSVHSISLTTICSPWWEFTNRPLWCEFTNCLLWCEFANSLCVQQLLFLITLQPSTKMSPSNQLKECPRAFSQHTHKSEIYETPAAPLRVPTYRSVVTQICKSAHFLSPVIKISKPLSHAAKPHSAYRTTKGTAASFGVMNSLCPFIGRLLRACVVHMCRSPHIRQLNYPYDRPVSFPLLQTKEHIQVIPRSWSSLVHDLDICSKYVGERRSLFGYLTIFTACCVTFEVRFWNSNGKFL